MLKQATKGPSVDDFEQDPTGDIKELLTDRNNFGLL
jgi:hypothetical protein